MHHSESYRGVQLDVHTSVLASGRNAFVVYVAGKVVTVDIDGLNAAETLEMAVKMAKKFVERTHPPA